ncbi:MAG: glycosyltransferase family 2 protein [Paludibacteraceae bacterium]|nr:glycosyltransferase family 2 protein [Paludibacteraceae bacterium]
MAAKVSIIIPVYGVEKYIERCAISLFEQTLDDIEYIFVNDCTPDCSIEILKDVLNRYPNRVSQVQILNMPYNSGQAAVRKLGIENATGEYIIHCDSDDWVEHDMYETLYKTAKEGAYDIVICDYFEAKNTSDFHHILQYTHEDKFDLIRNMLNGCTHGFLWNKLVNSQLYCEIDFPVRNLHEDLATVIQLVYFAKKLKHIKIPFYYYFRNSQSITNVNKNLNQCISAVEQSIDNYNLIENFMKKHNILKLLKKEQFNMRCRIKVAALVFLLSDRPDKYHLLFDDINIFNLSVSNLRFISKLEFFISKLRLYPIFWILKNKTKRFIQ